MINLPDSAWDNPDLIPFRCCWKKKLLERIENLNLYDQHCSDKPASSTSSSGLPVPTSCHHLWSKEPWYSQNQTPPASEELCKDGHEGSGNVQQQKETSQTVRGFDITTFTRAAGASAAVVALTSSWLATQILSPFGLLPQSADQSIFYMGVCILNLGWFFVLHLGSILKAESDIIPKYLLMESDCLCWNLRGLMARLLLHWRQWRLQHPFLMKWCSYPCSDVRVCWNCHIHRGL